MWLVSGFDYSTQTNYEEDTLFNEVEICSVKYPKANLLFRSLLYKLIYALFFEAIHLLDD